MLPCQGHHPLQRGGALGLRLRNRICFDWSLGPRHLHRPVRNRIRQLLVLVAQPAVPYKIHHAFGDLHRLLMRRAVVQHHQALPHELLRVRLLFVRISAVWHVGLVLIGLLKRRRPPPSVLRERLRDGDDELLGLLQLRVQGALLRPLPPDLILGRLPRLALRRHRFAHRRRPPLPSRLRDPSRPCHGLLLLFQELGASRGPGRAQEGLFGLLNLGHRLWHAGDLGSHGCEPPGPVVLVLAAGVGEHAPRELNLVVLVGHEDGDVIVPEEARREDDGEVGVVHVRLAHVHLLEELAEPGDHRLVLARQLRQEDRELLRPLLARGLLACRDGVVVELGWDEGRRQLTQPELEQRGVLVARLPAAVERRCVQARGVAVALVVLLHRRDIAVVPRNAEAALRHRPLAFLQPQKPVLKEVRHARRMHLHPPR